MKKPWLPTAFSVLLLPANLLPAQTVIEGAPNYVSPSQIARTGQAPGMKVQLLSDQGGQKDYAVIFSTGDDAYTGLYEFAQKYHVTSAHFTAIGAISGATLGWFDPSR